jgi:hypothetical protein
LSNGQILSILTSNGTPLVTYVMKAVPSAIPLNVNGFYMLRFIERHGQVIQSVATLATAFAAVAAVLFVPWQIAANDRNNRAQAAREIYREFLSISIQRPELTALAYCSLTDPVERAAHESYVDYLLYTAEQVLDLNAADWEAAIGARLRSHAPYLCTFQNDDLDALTPAVAEMVSQIVSDCPAASICEEHQP